MFQNLFAQPHTKTFLQIQEKSYSYYWLQQKIREISGLFQLLNIRTGDRILLAVSEPAENSAIFLAALVNGISIIIADPESKAPRACSIITRTQPRCIIADKESLNDWKVPFMENITILSFKSENSSKTGLLSKFLQKSKPEPDPHDYLTALDKCIPVTSLPDEVSADQLAYIIFTSGTTTNAKGVAITHGNLAAHLSTLKKVYGLNEESMLLNQLLLCHADGCIQGPVLTAYAGCTWHRPFRFSMDKIHFLLDYCYANNISHFFVVPAMLNMIVQFAEKYEESFQYPEFKAILSVSAHLEAPLWDKFESIFKIPVSNIYGLTETVAGSLFCGSLPGTYRKYTVGKPVDCSVRIVNENGEESDQGTIGELCLRGEHIMKNYWGEPLLQEEAIKAGWFYTGDLASMDEAGFITIRGRKKNLIISGGINIQPEEVTECLLQFPAISEACALGLLDDVFGEKLVAAVSLKPGYSATSTEIVAHCRELLEEKKIPTRVHILPALPKGVSGKVLLSTLREQLSKQSFKMRSVNGHFEEEVIRLAAESFQVPVATLSIRDTSQTVAGWDSLAHLIFITSLEDHFKISFNIAEVITLNSIQKATELIKEKHG